MNAGLLPPNRIPPLCDDELTPRCSGCALAEIDDADEYAATKRQCIEAYRHINHRARELRQVRATRNFNPADERAALQAIESALLARDALDDKYARLGIIATPVTKDGFIRDVEFSTPRPPTDEPSFLSMCFAVMPPSFYEEPARAEATDAL